MIKVYGMPTCPDCVFVDEQIKDNANFQIIDIGANVRSLREFLNLRDKLEAFLEAKKTGSIGIPCFMLEDGTVSLNPAVVGLKQRTEADVIKGQACSLDGTGC